MKFTALTLFLTLSAEFGSDSLASHEATVLPASITLSSVVMPDFASYTNVQQKKLDFFSFMLPHIRAENSKILEQREFLLHLLPEIQSNQVLDKSDLEIVAALYQRYKLPAPKVLNTSALKELLNRVDLLPASMVLAQSANESGWGTSRFARQANNFFGIWCFKAGCGLPPRNRDVGLTHEVAKYESVPDGVRAYMLVLNTHKAYEPLRGIRASQRNQNHPITGEAIAKGLKPYSERGDSYVRDIQQLIRVNNLSSFTEA